MLALVFLCVVLWFSRFHDDLYPRRAAAPFAPGSGRPAAHPRHSGSFDRLTRPGEPADRDVSAPGISIGPGA
jgi:hypothetical protein